jgi:DNA-binding NtrC family response regulator
MINGNGHRAMGNGFLNVNGRRVASSVEPIPNRSITPLNILIVDDEQTTREVCRTVAETIGMKVWDVGTAEEAMELLESSSIDILLTDLRLPGTSGLELLRQVTVVHPDVAVVMLTQYGSIGSAVEATRMGAADYVTKPFRVDELRARLEQVARSVELKRENRLLREQVRTKPGFGGMIGMSARMERVYKMIEKVSMRDHPVLILGENGTGKELVARSIHFLGSRKDKPFVPVDCSTLVPTLVETELFGHAKGAFTGALQARHGIMEAANGGTLFLDEIGNMPLEMQVKLLRALQQREVKPVGSTERRTIDVRIVAATSRDLDEAIKKGEFRQDLFFRLNVVQIKVPALRERKSDIPLLVAAFLEKFGDPKAVPWEMTESATRELMTHDWPGNVRELENVVERTIALCTGPYVTDIDLPTSVRYTSAASLPNKEEIMPLQELERRAILHTLSQSGGDKQATARRLGIGKTTLYRKLKEYRVDQSPEPE